jgi:hypothetical protein
MNKHFFTIANISAANVASLDSLENALNVQYQSEINNAEIFQRSKDFGRTVAERIYSWSTTDGSLNVNQPYVMSALPLWQPTAPNPSTVADPYWGNNRLLVQGSTTGTDSPLPPPYSIDPNSAYYAMVKEVYDVNKNLTSEQREIAKFWDDNPFVVEHSGHLMFGNKKITPGGHWMGIAAIASKQTHADEVKIAKAYAMTAIALFDAFISCWDAKYKWSYIRPVTVINDKIEKTWTSLLQTPPFPEYTSGHSTITASAATVLTQLYGDDFAFQDTSDLRYIGMQRHFDSFLQASDECSVSRLYGGIHYRLSVDKGAEAGRKIGKYIINKLGL